MTNVSRVRREEKRKKEYVPIFLILRDELCGAKEGLFNVLTGFGGGLDENKSVFLCKLGCFVVADIDLRF